MRGNEAFGTAWYSVATIGAITIRNCIVVIKHSCSYSYSYLYIKLWTYRTGGYIPSMRNEEMYKGWSCNKSVLYCSHVGSSGYSLVVYNTDKALRIYRARDGSYINYEWILWRELQQRYMARQLHERGCLGVPWGELRLRFRRGLSYRRIPGDISIHIIYWEFTEENITINR